MHDEPDHYATLQVAPTAEPAVIAAAYRALARRYHPDVAGAEGEAMMRRLNAAWEVLSDPERRAAYDRERAGRSRGDGAATGATAPPSGPDAVAGTEPSRPERRSSTSSPSTPAEPSPFGPAGPPPGRPHGSVLAFGLFRGWSLGEIARVDPGYLEWLEGKPEGRPYLGEIDELLRAIGWRRPPDERRPGVRHKRRWRFGPG